MVYDGLETTLLWLLSVSVASLSRSFLLQGSGIKILWSHLLQAGLALGGLTELAHAASDGITMCVHWTPQAFSLQKESSIAIAIPLEKYFRRSLVEVSNN